MKTIAFFNNKGGVGKTSLVYHLAYLFANNGLKVIAADLDPQANLTSMFLDEDRLEELWTEIPRPSIYTAIQPILDGIGDLLTPQAEVIRKNLSLVVGDLQLSQAEDELSTQWTTSLGGNPRGFRVISAFWRILASVAEQQAAELVLIDVGPNLGAINRAALISADYVIVPMAPDLFSLQGLQNLGPTLGNWRKAWQTRLDQKPSGLPTLPQGKMQPIGYIILQHGIRANRPVKAYQRWIEKIPGTYREAVLDKNIANVPSAVNDPYCLALFKHYRSLMPLAMEAHKPMFELKPADGAIGAHVTAVSSCHADFHKLGRKISDAIGLKFEWYS
jgi:chromosome partitioning protein